MIDPPTEDLTCRLLELMGNLGFDRGYGRARRGVAFLRRTQRDDGAWWGRWGGNFIYGTWSALAGLRAIGEPLDAPCIGRAVAWLATRQNPDGGWGETLGSYDDETLAGRGVSTPSQTAWALLGLLAGTDGVGDPVRRGIEHLLDTQRADGGWDETEFTGTGFPRHFYLRYWMYRDYFPLMALGQCRARLEERR
jgi:squalene-hopene/tetraprenyl-beta-curcumene cyclase